jgi:hypothetical protein
MKKAQFLEKLDRAWDELQQAHAGLSPAQMQQPAASGEWCVKDILAHVTTWEQEALKYLPLILMGDRPPRYKDLYGGIDAFNDQMTAQKRSMSLDAVLQQKDEVHWRLMEYLRGVDEAQFTSETRFRRRLRLDTYSHYPIHTNAIREWRGSRD